MITVKDQQVRRVLMTADTVGGVWSYVKELANQFQRRGIEIALATMGPPPDRQQRQEIVSLGNVELFESSYKLEWMDDPWGDLEEAAEWLLELEILTHPDIVHLNGYIHAAFPWHAPVVVVGHSCVCSWFDRVKNSDIPVSWQYYQSRVREGLRSADCVIAPSVSMLSLLKKHYGEFAPSSVVYNGRSVDCFNPTLKETFVLTAGRVWDEAKNISTLVKSASKIGWPLIVAGEHGEIGDLASQSVTFLGRLAEDDLAVWISKAPIFALPAVYEPFGFSALEAGIAGCALVLGDIDSLREIWGDAALYVDPYDCDALSVSIQRLIDNPAIRREYARRAMVRSSQFTPGLMAENYLRIYRGLIARDVNKTVQTPAMISPAIS